MEFSWSEMLVVGIAALVIIGPKDLPGMFRELGRFTAKIRAMGREFNRAMEQAAKESGVKDVVKDINTIASPKNLGLNAVKNLALSFSLLRGFAPKRKGAFDYVQFSKDSLVGAVAAKSLTEKINRRHGENAFFLGLLQNIGMLIMVDDKRLPLKEGEQPRMETVRFRSLGCYPLSGAVRSTAADLTAVIEEMLVTRTSERQSRAIDADSAAAMENRKREGYF